MTTWMDTLVAYAHEQLDERVTESLWGRGVDDEQMAIYQIGHLNRSLPQLPKEAEGFLKWVNEADRLNDVYVLPLTNALGEILGIQLRHVDQAKKGYREFVLSREEPVFFGLGQAAPYIWQTRRVFLVEGAFDVFPVQRVIPQTFATLTARVTDQLVRFLRRLVRHICLGYDMDQKGREASRAFAKAYEKDFQIQIVTYPQAKQVDGKIAKDPAEIWEAWGDPRLQEFLLSTQEN